MGDRMNQVRDKFLGKKVSPQKEAPAKQEAKQTNAAQPLLNHKFKTSGNLVGLFKYQKDGQEMFRVTTVFVDKGEKIIDRRDFTPAELAKRLMGKKN